jgi:oxaloacetate decarboxylase gamma subunit
VLLSQGVELMVYGMGTVVLFLTLLVFATRLMSRIVGRYFSEAEPASAAAPTTPAPRSSAAPEVVAAISAALHRHRGDRR